MRCEICDEWLASGRTCVRCEGRPDLGFRWLPPTLEFEEEAEGDLNEAPAALQVEVQLDRRKAPRDEVGAASQEAAVGTSDFIEAAEESSSENIPAALDDWEEGWEEGLAASYREAAGQGASGVLVAMAEKLEAKAGLPKNDRQPPLVSAQAEVEEPEGMGFELEADRWGIWRRQVLSWVIDGVLLVSFLTLASAASGPGPEIAAFSLIVAFSYLTLCGFLGGRTLGDRVAGLQTISGDSGAAPTLSRAALRAVVGIVGVGVFFFGLVWSIFDEDGRPLHDRLSQTWTIPTS